jgi:hypothetical protein
LEKKVVSTGNLVNEGDERQFMQVNKEEFFFGIIIAMPSYRFFVKIFSNFDSSRKREGNN